MTTRDEEVANLVMSTGRSLGCSPNSDKLRCTTVPYRFSIRRKHRALRFLLSTSGFYGSSLLIPRPTCVGAVTVDSLPHPSTFAAGHNLTLQVGAIPPDLYRSGYAMYPSPIYDMEAHVALTTVACSGRAIPPPLKSEGSIVVLTLHWSRWPIAMWHNMIGPCFFCLNLNIVV
jgi:hypothetical protein